jgi:hypothetical protein
MATFVDYREGRLFRFQQRYSEDSAPANSHCVQHLWLCKGCSETYTLEYRRDRVTLLDRRPIKSTRDKRDSLEDGFLDSSQTPVLCDLSRVEDSSN